MSAIVLSMFPSWHAVHATQGLLHSANYPVLASHLLEEGAGHCASLTDPATHNLCERAAVHLPARQRLQRDGWQHGGVNSHLCSTKFEHGLVSSR